MSVKLSTEIAYLKGVGEKRAALYGKLGIKTIGDLLHYYPRDYIDATKPYTLENAPLGENVVLKLTVLKKSGEQIIKKGMSVFKVSAYDDTGSIMITFFNSKYTVQSLKEGEEYLFYGKLSGNFIRKEMSAPAILNTGDFNGMIPVYSQTAGLSSKIIQANVKQAIELTMSEPIDALPQGLKHKNELCHIEYAVREIHNPQDRESLEVARRRLVFEELFILSLGLLQVKNSSVIRKISPMKKKSLKKFYDLLPYKLTTGQKTAIKEITEDMCSGKAMNRLVQGDVGCGKTMVAAAAAYFSFLNHGQTALMAPTEILANQHYESLNKIMLELGVKTALLTGSTTAKEKKNIKEQLKNGNIDICIGTHALLTCDVKFKNLALVITDEQHRFGVAQRTALAEKGEFAHTLVMSATPIPRTLALIVYGDLQVSQIKEMPKGRIPVETMRINSARKERAFNFIKSKLDQGRQAYIVCPLVETGEIDMGLKSAEEFAKELSKNQFKDYKVGIIHGKMKSKDKDDIMKKFKSGDIQLLVSTTVIEVGVDVPNSVIMMIVNAERFGLSQLHQLRGRVGRGSEKSYCILLSDSKNPDTLRRLNVLCNTSDGFEIAEEDLKLRGAGDFFGSRQHGLPEFQIADPVKDLEIFKDAQREAIGLLEADPTLSDFENRYLKKKVDRMMSSVGYSPN